MRSCPVLQQLPGRLPAAGEELIRQVPVGERSGELGAPIMRPRIVSAPVRAVGACRVETRRDVVRGVEQLVGEDLSGGGGAAGDLVEQRGRWAAGGALVAVLGV